MDEYKLQDIWKKNLREFNDVMRLDSIIIRSMQEAIKKTETKQCAIHSVSKRFDDQKFIDNVIGSYRHDFGLLNKEEQDKLMFECKEWMRAIKNNEPY